MNEHTEHIHHEHNHPANGEYAVAAGSRLPRISWGAIFAGVVVTLALSWLLHLLGTSIGVSIADASDTVAMGEGVAGGVAIWIVLSWLISFFIGSLVAARLAGSLEDFSGMLHGLVLWGLGTIIAVYLGYSGVMSVLNTGQQLVSATVAGTAQAVSGVASGIGTATTSVSSGISQAMDTKIARDIRSRLSESAIEAAADMDEQLSEQDIRTAVNELDQRTLRRVTQDLMNDDQEGAAELLADSSELSQQDAQALIDGAYRELEEQFGNPDNEQSLSQDLKGQLAGQVDGYIASLDSQGGVEVTAKDVRTAIDKLDSETMTTISNRLINGDTQGAQRALVANTNLSQEQINAIYSGVEEDISQEIEAYQQELKQAAEAVSTYTQEVLWLTFAGSALALAVSLGGGWLGADSARRLYVEQYGPTSTT
ncbi:hypothetical protein NG895_00500 [Aeoliella sp. ICT_H6.2]|uniref:CAP-Gly protein n=1 Tax=Aeoliella straminimaris TaxID=2954799 RepID=A0A9X2JGZ1_9BACT|nr:hypothetical protein [Aeoliella straminimaris]MCO6042374.1 hypothetical protein [Aeoliella straminimaris]